MDPAAFLWMVSEVEYSPNSGLLMERGEGLNVATLGDLESVLLDLGRRGLGSAPGRSVLAVKV